MKEKKEISLTELTADELKARLEESKEKLFHLKFGHKTTPLKNPLEIRYLRRQIARILTIMRNTEQSRNKEHGTDTEQFRVSSV